MNQPIFLKDVQKSGKNFELSTDCKILLIGEGGDDANVLEALSRHLGVNGACGLDLQGRSNLNSQLSLLPNIRGFDELDAVAIVLDAESADGQSNADKTLQMINRVLTDSPFNLAESVPHGGFAQLPERNPRVGVFVLPGGGVKEGMLEDLFWNAVENTPEADCVKKFRNCLNKTEKRGPMKNPAKRQIQAFLSAMPAHCVNLGVMVNKLDKSIVSGFFDAPAFNELRQFLQALSDFK